MMVEQPPQTNNGGGGGVNSSETTPTTTLAKGHQLAFSSTSNLLTSDHQPYVQSTLSKRALAPTKPIVLEAKLTQEDLERRKNEIVQEMLQRIRPFVGAAGQLRPDSDFEAYARMMEGEVHYVQKTLLLTVLMSAAANKANPPEANPDGNQTFKAMGGCPSLLKILAEWLNESVKHLEQPMIEKILFLFERIPLNVDQLVTLRLGKIVKKVTGLSEVKQEIRDKSLDLCEKWTKLARQEDSRRGKLCSNPDNKSSTNKHTNSQEVRKSSASIDSLPLKGDNVVANMTLFSSEPLASTTPAPPIKTRGAQLLERIARGETAKLETRPMSADDIHKAKKRQMYLQESTMEGSVLNVDEDKIEELKYKKVKRRVSFASDPDLVTIHYFEPDEDESPHHHYVDRHEMDRNEALYAFKQAALSMEPEIEWKSPRPLSDLPSSTHLGSRSKELEVQEQRERTALSAVYFSKDDIPPSPLEPPTLETTLMVTSGIKNIPLKDLDGRVVPVIRYIPGPTSPPISNPVAPINTDFLNSLLGNPSALHDILKNVKPPGSTGIEERHVVAPPVPPPPMVMPPMVMGMGMRFPPPISFPPPLPMRPPMPLPGDYGFIPGNFRPPPPSASKTRLCKYYKRGKPNSCRNGTSCQFLHSDY